jgi:protein-S-isoprenylcysteine O-methyltransferase Ste14
VLAKPVPAGIGAHMTTTIFAMLSSLQIALTFLAWSPVGRVCWEPHGALRAVITAAYACSWLLVMKSMSDAGLEIQTGSVGWTSVARGRAPRHSDFPTCGSFRYVRQPIYLAFTLTLWTGPVWTPDHLLIAVLWTLYCIAGPALKERGYLGYYGARFRRYREQVPYWVPSSQKLDPVLLSSSAISSTRN